MRMALTIDPNYHAALFRRAEHPLARGRFDSALDAMREAVEHSPLHDTTGTQRFLIVMKRYDEAIRLGLWARRAN
jgi:hypothetical protein